MHEYSKKPPHPDVIEHSLFDTIISKWKDTIGIPHYTIKTFQVPPEMVTEANFEIGGEFVGITPNHSEMYASLFHTRPLEDDDIVHELLHIKYPEWGENEINSKVIEVLTYDVTEDEDTKKTV